MGNVLPFKNPNVKAYIDEMSLKRLWMEGLLSGRVFTADNGADIKIISPGKWNKSQGPDFLNCRLSFDGREIMCDVEVHIEPDDWYRHLHHTNPIYNDVKLHLTLKGDTSEKIYNSAGKRVPQVSIERVFSYEVLKLINDYWSGDVSFFPGWINFECKLDSKNINADHLLEYYKNSGFERISAKADRYKTRIAEVGYEQAIYEGILESSGYTANRFSFLLLAGTLTLRRVREILTWTSPEDRKITSEALFLGAARLLPGVFEKESTDLDLESSIRLREVERRWKRLRAAVADIVLSQGIIRSGFQRPLASPVSTIAGIANFISENFDKNLLILFERCIRDADEDTGKISSKVSRLLNPVPADFWCHHTSYSNLCFHRHKVFGTERINRFIGNVLIPVFLHYSRSRCDKKLEDLILKTAMKLRACHNRYTRFIFKSLPTKLKSDLKLTFLLEQGFINQYQKYCSFSLCGGCPLNNMKNQAGG